MIKERLKNKKGSAMIVVIMVFIVLAILSITAHFLMTSETRLAYKSYDEKQAHYMAMSGLNAVTSYIVDNPDNLSNSKMEETINEMISHGESSKITLEDGSEDNFSVVLTRNGNTLNILSTGRSGDVESTVQMILKKDSSVDLDAALYLDGDSIVDDITKVNGDVVLTRLGINLEINNGAEITGQITTEEMDFPMPDFPDYPELISNGGTLNSNSDKNPSVLSANTYYTNGLEYSSSSPNEITVNVANDDVVIRTKSFILEETALKINRTGTGRFILFIDGDSVPKISKADFNAGGDYDASIIYYDSIDKFKDGSDPYQTTFDIQDSDVCSNMFIKAKKLDIKGTTRIDGQIVYEGLEGGINNKEGILFENKAESNTVLIYAPGSFVDIKNEYDLDGIVIAGALQLINSAEVSYVNFDESYLLSSVLVGDYIMVAYK